MSVSTELTSYFEAKLTYRGISEKPENGNEKDKLFHTTDIFWDDLTLWAPSNVARQISSYSTKQIKDAAKSWIFSLSECFSNLLADHPDDLTRQLSVSLPTGDDPSTALTPDENHSFLVGYEPLAVFRPLSPRSVLFVVVDTLVNVITYICSSDFVFLSVLEFLAIIGFFVYCFVMRPKFVKDTYHDHIANAMLGLRCDCPPGRYVRNLSLHVIALTLVYKIAAWLMISETARTNGLETLDACSLDMDTCWFDNSSVATNHKYNDFVREVYDVKICGSCSGTSSILFLLTVIPFIAMMEVYVVFSTYSDLTSAAQEAVVIQAKKVEKFHHPLTEELLTKTELQCGNDVGFLQKRPYMYWFIVMVCFGLAVGGVVPFYKVEDSHGNTISPEEGFTIAYSLFFVFEMFYVVVEVTNCLYSTYHSCLCRMHLLSVALKTILSEAMEYTLSQTGSSDNSKTASRTGSNVIDDCNFSARLLAWFHTRRFFMDLIFPLTYSLCNLCLFAMTLTTLALSVFAAIQFVGISEAQSINSGLSGLWPLFCVTTWIGGGVIVVLAKAVDLYNKSQSQIRMMKSFLMESSLARQIPHDSALLQRSTSANVVFKKRQPIPSDGRWWLHKIKVENDNEEIRDDDNEGAGGCGLSNFCEGVQSVIDYAEKYDTPATLLSIRVTPLLLNSAIGYVASGATALVLSLIYSLLFVPG